MRNLSGIRNGGEVKGKICNRKVQYGIEKSDQNRTKQNKTEQNMALMEECS
jgi:hypothetical protein